MPPSNAKRLWTGQTIDGRFLIGKVLRTSMGVVYLAKDVQTGHDVVVKAPLPTLGDAEVFIDRFLHEIKVLARMTHPNVVGVLNYGKRDGLPYFIMPYLAGGALDSRRPRDEKKQPVPAPVASLSQWLPQVAAALDFIHAKSFVHRDVKPANVLFDAHGTPFLSDFGVAKKIGDGAVRQQGLTGTGLVLGTPEYMAPELVMANEYDGRIDQYALAATVFDMLAGRPIFQGQTPAAILVQQASGRPPALHSLAPGVPTGLSAAVARGLAKKPADRFSNCSSFARAVLAGASSPVRAPLGLEMVSAEEEVASAPPTLGSFSPRTGKAFAIEQRAVRAEIVGSSPKRRSKKRPWRRDPIIRWASAASLVILSLFTGNLAWKVIGDRAAKPTTDLGDAGSPAGPVEKGRLEIPSIPRLTTYVGEGESQVTFRVIRVGIVGPLTLRVEPSSSARPLPPEMQCPPIEIAQSAETAVLRASATADCPAGMYAANLSWGDANEKAACQIQIVKRAPLVKEDPPARVSPPETAEIPSARTGTTRDDVVGVWSVTGIPVKAGENYCGYHLLYADGRAVHLTNGAKGAWALDSWLTITFETPGRPNAPVVERWDVSSGKPPFFGTHPLYVLHGRRIDASTSDGSPFVHLAEQVKEMTALYDQRPRKNAEFLAAFKRLYPLDPHSARICSQGAWMMATASDARYRDGGLAIELSRTVCEEYGYTFAPALEELAAAYAEAGQFDKAIETVQRVRVVQTSGKPDPAPDKWTSMFRIGAPIREGIPMMPEEDPFPAEGPPSGDDEEPGLVAELFRGTCLNKWITTHIDPKIDYKFPNGVVDPAVGNIWVSVRWTGWVNVPVAATYRFTTRCDDGVRLSIDGNRIIDHWTNGATEQVGVIALQGGRHWLHMEYYQDSGPGFAHLYWSKPGMGKKLKFAIPPEAFTHSKKYAARKSAEK